MADLQVLGDYDPEQVTITLTAIKEGVEIVPSQFGPDSRIVLTGVVRSESIEGQGGTVIRSRVHGTLRSMTMTIMSTDPAMLQLSDLFDKGEIFKFLIVDNSATDSKISGKCWVQTTPDWSRGRVAEPVAIAFEAQVPREAARYGQTSIIA